MKEILDGVQQGGGSTGSDGADGVGVPVGGNTGQTLSKASNGDYDTEWATASGSGDMLSTNNLSDLADDPTARTNLGVDAAGTDNSDDNAANTNYANDYRAANFVAGTDYEPAKGSDDNFVTDAEKTVIGNTSGANAGDQAAGDFAHDSLASIPVNDHLDWTADQGAKNIHAGNYTDTNTTDHTALSNIGSKTHATLDSEVGVNNAKVGVTDQTNDDTVDAHILDTDNPHEVNKTDVGLSAVPNTDFTTAVGLNTAKNSYPSGDETKVGHISVTQAVNLDTMESNIATNNAKVGVTTEEANNISDVNATDLTDGGVTTLHSHAGGGGDLLSTNNLSDLADDPTARTNLGVDIAGTDNSTDVTLAGEDFLSLSGQQVTANPVDLDNLSATGTPSSSNYLRGDNTWATPAGGGSAEFFFPIWAEENSTLGAANTYEWAFGNGANTAINEGVMMYVPSGFACTCVAMGAQIGTASSSATIELVVNQVVQGSAANIVITSAANGLAELSTPLSISSGDMVNFRTTSSSTTQAACTVIAWFRMVAT